MILVAVSVALAAAGQENPPRLTEREALAAVVAEGDAQASRDLLSGTLLVARCDAVLLEKAWGQADRERHLPMKIDTRMRLGSMNKMFTAIAILQLEEQGRIALDQPFGRYLRDYPNADAAARVTIRHLLTHTGGTGDIFGPQFSECRLSLREHTDYLQLYGARPLLHEPGAEWRYSNYGYVLLGRVIEVVTGQSYYDHVRTRIFAPAGMRLTDSLPEAETVASRSVGYARREGEWTPHVGTLPWRGTAAGGGYSTVGDLLRFARALETGKLLSQASLAKATTVHANNYGFGFIIQGEGALRNYGHSGGAPGMNGELRIYPALGYVIASLSNLDPPAASNLVRHLRQRLPEGPAKSCDADGVAVAATSRAPQQPPASRFTNINPAWSPDGTRLLFQSERSGGTDIYVMNADGTGVTRLTDHPAADTHARWSPDGRQFVFDSERDGAWHIYIANADGSNVRRVTTPDQARNGSAGRHPDWSRDGTSLVFDSNRDGDEEVYVSSIDGTKQQRITASPGRDGHAVWSPDGSRILFGSARAGNTEIFTADRDGGTPVNLSRHAASDLGAKWSPDGSRIVFTSTRDGNEDIFTMNADGSGPVNILKHPDIVYESDWSPDGRQIAFYSNRGGGFELFVMRRDGSDLRQLTGRSQR